MTRKDFELIARVIRESREDSDDYFDGRRVVALDAIAENFERALRATNPRFDGVRFLEATYEKTGRPGAELTVREIRAGELALLAGGGEIRAGELAREDAAKDLAATVSLLNERS